MTQTLEEKVREAVCGAAVLGWNDADFGINDDVVEKSVQDILAAIEEERDWQQDYRETGE